MYQTCSSPHPSKIKITHLLAGVRAERFTPETLRPLEAKPVQHRLAAGSRLLTERPAGRSRFPQHTLGSVDGAQEGLYVGGAPGVDERRKRMNHQACVVLVLVAQDVGQDGLGVRQVFADGDGDPLTGWRRSLSHGIVLALNGQKQESAQMGVLPLPPSVQLRLHVTLS